MRIISGKWGGRRLVPFKSQAIRPTTDRVKETIFNMIGPDVQGAKVLDLFAGTGNLGFEALSRGAKSVTAVDKGADSKKVILKNAEMLGVDKKDYKFISMDVLSYINKVQEPYDYILIDPPFTLKMGAEVMRFLEQSKAYHADTSLFIEYIKEEEVFDSDTTKIYLHKLKKYGDKSLGVYYIKEEGGQ